MFLSSERDEKYGGEMWNIMRSKYIQLEEKNHAFYTRTYPSTIQRNWKVILLKHDFIYIFIWLLQPWSVYNSITLLQPLSRPVFGLYKHACVYVNHHYPAAVLSVHLPIKAMWLYKHWCTWDANLANGSSARYEWLNTGYMFHFDPQWGTRTRLPPMKPINDKSMMDSCTVIKCKACYWLSMLGELLAVQLNVGAMEMSWAPVLHMLAPQKH